MILLFVRSFLIICVNKVAHLVCHDIVLLFIRFLVVSVEWTTMRTVRHARLGVTSITQRQLSHEWSLAAGWILTLPLALGDGDTIGFATKSIGDRFRLR